MLRIICCAALLMATTATAQNPLPRWVVSVWAVLCEAWGVRDCVPLDTRQPAVQFRAASILLDISTTKSA